jgi:hypothetical protein
MLALVDNFPLAMIKYAMGGRGRSISQRAEVFKKKTKKKKTFHIKKN